MSAHVRRHERRPNAVFGPVGATFGSPLWGRSQLSDSFWRNCLEIRNESRSGDCRAARRGRRVVYLPLLAPTTHPPEAFQLFSKQFLHALRCIRARDRAEAARPRPSITWLCSDQLVLTKASMSTRVDVEDAFF